MLYEIQRKALDKAKAEIEYAGSCVKYYNNLIDSLPFCVDDISTPEDLLKIPFSQKSDYKKNFPAGIIAKPYRLSDSRLHNSRSSGTGGDRLHTVELGGVYMQRALHALKVNKTISTPFFENPRKHCRYAPPNCSDVECASPYTSRGDRVLRDGTLVLSVYHDLLTTPDSLVESAIGDIEIYKPDMLYVDPSHLSFLSQRAMVLGRALPNIPVLSSYTMKTQISNYWIRRSIPTAPVASVLAMSELGYLASECEHGNMHLNTDSFFAEVVRSGAHAKEGELGELVLTTLQQGACPFIRYKTGDVVRLLKVPCECGSSFPTVQFEGRVKQLVLRDGEVLLTPLQVDELVGVIENMSFYQFKQVSESRFAFSYINSDGGKVLQSEIIDVKERFMKVLGADCEVGIYSLPYIESSRGGKFIHCVSDVAEVYADSGGVL